MNDWVREELVDALEPHQVAEIAGELETDDAVAIIEDMEEDEQRAVLRALDPDDRAAIEEALSYPEESAGRLMQRDADRGARALDGRPGDRLSARRRGAGHRFLGGVRRRSGAPAGRHLPAVAGSCARRARIAVADVMKREQTLIPVDMDQEEVALRFQKYALISAAVVDQAGRLVGMITVDDIVHIIQEEASEDVLLLSGAGARATSTSRSSTATRRGCAGWSPISAPRSSPRRSSPVRRGDRADGRARGADADRRRRSAAMPAPRRWR